ncbi:MAG: helix-turn-helix domain-containing protein, partial [Planctomycetaceae bacterium]|nr:helix-turn-helix domain-containing protein [Planctomycetaceae bacterium]
MCTTIGTRRRKGGSVGDKSNNSGNGSGGGDPDLLAARVGRPRVLTEAVQRRIVELVAEGNHLSTAAKVCGTSIRTVNCWMQRFREGDPKASEYGPFLLDLKKAAALGEAALLGRIRIASETTWQAAAWLLERRYPKHWARKDVIEVRGNDGDLSKLSDQDLVDITKKS